MAFQSIWYFTDLPKDIIDIIERDLSVSFDSSMEDSGLIDNTMDKNKRNSQNAWVPTTHWLGRFIWHYIERANRENFLYDLRCIDHESIQYSQYNRGQFYGWHNDSDLPTQYKPIAVGNRSDALVQDFLNTECEMVRKLSFVLQLSDPDDYEGGNLQLLDENRKCYFAEDEEEARTKG